jgi:hypothetical protein
MRMIRNTTIIALLAAITLSCLPQCSAKILTRFDYEDSLRHHRRGNTGKAIESFPKGERGGFITTMEKTALNILDGKPEIDNLARYAKKVDDRVRFKVSRDIQGFFYLETREGYYASEHEVIWMHMLLGLGNLMRGDKDRARVEMKKSANLLSTAWSDEGHFDDPFLRVIAAGLWTMLGQWDEACVDFRRAAMMAPRLTWAKNLAARDTPPKELVLVLGGPGPEPRWDPHSGMNPLRAARDVKFIQKGLKSPLALSDSIGRNLTMYITPDSSTWYQRHFVRNNEISDLIKDSNYAARVTAGTLTATSSLAFGIAIGAAIMAGGIGIGGGLVYVAAEVGSEELASIGVILAAGGLYYGYDAGKKIINDGMTKTQQILDISDSYRFVRFLPEYAWVGWKDVSLIWPLTGSVGRGRNLSLPGDVHVVIRINGVTLAFYPDAREKILR